MHSSDQMRTEVHALWAAVFGEPPIVEAEMSILLDVLVRSLPNADYDVIRRYGVVQPFDEDEARPQSGREASDAPPT